MERTSHRVRRWICDALYARAEPHSAKKKYVLDDVGDGDSKTTIILNIER